MALSSCLYRSLSSSLPCLRLRCPRTKSELVAEGKCDVKNVNTQLRSREVISSRTLLRSRWNFVRRSRINFASNQSLRRRKVFDIQASSGLSTSQIARSVFTFGTATVLPFYTLMVFAPKAEITKKVVESNIPYIVLGLLYAYLLYLSWTPNTLRFMFSGKYLLPELQGIAKMFSSEMTLASAWIHLLVIDLFAARQVFHDGIENKIETRHSISLCLLFCPIGIFSHFITKALTNNVMNMEHGK